MSPSAVSLATIFVIVALGVRAQFGNALTASG